MVHRGLKPGYYFMFNEIFDVLVNEPWLVKSAKFGELVKTAHYLNISISTIVLIRNINIIGKGENALLPSIVKMYSISCLPGILGPSSGGPGGPEGGGGGGGLLLGWEGPDLDGLGTTLPLLL